VALAKTIYDLTSTWPANEQFGLTSQTRRAVISVSANIAEGQGRGGVREFRRHVSIANGSLCELETHVHLACILGFISLEQEADFMAESTEVARTIGGLLKHLDGRIAQESDQGPTSKRDKPTNDHRPTTRSSESFDGNAPAPGQISKSSHWAYISEVRIEAQETRAIQPTTNDHRPTTK